MTASELKNLGEALQSVSSVSSRDGFGDGPYSSATAVPHIMMLHSLPIHAAAD